MSPLYTVGAWAFVLVFGARVVYILIDGVRGPGSWTCSHAYDCVHWWRWTAIVCQQVRRVRRGWRRRC